MTRGLPVMSALPPKADIPRSNVRYWVYSGPFSGQYPFGVQVLVCAGKNQFTLQPLGIERSSGFGIAAGLGYRALPIIDMV